MDACTTLIQYSLTSCEVSNSSLSHNSDISIMISIIYKLMEVKDLMSSSFKAVLFVLDDDC